MKKALLFLILFVSISSFAQVGIGTSSPDPSAKLDVSSTTQGLLLPRLTTTQVNAISNPAAGLLVYNTTTRKFQGYTSSSTTITLQQLANTNQSYVLGYMNMMGMTSNYTDGQTFTIANSSTLNSIQVNLNNNSGVGFSIVTISVYSGSIGAANSTFSFSNPIATSSQTITTTGNITFNFTPTSLAPGLYYFNVSCNNMNYHMGVNTGGGFTDTDANGNSVNEIFFQTSGTGYNNYQATSQALYFIIGLSQVTSGWTNLN